jgi:hypothetical protein
MTLISDNCRVKKYGLNMLGASLTTPPNAFVSLTVPSIQRRSSQSLHQKDHVPTKQMDGQWQNIQIGGRHHKQGDW